MTAQTSQHAPRRRDAAATIRRRPAPAVANGSAWPSSRSPACST